MNTIKISVRNLVEFILRSGNLSTSSGLKDPDAMQEGARIHKKIQRKMKSGYQAEVALSIMFQSVMTTSILKYASRGVPTVFSQTKPVIILMK